MPNEAEPTIELDLGARRLGIRVRRVGEFTSAHSGRPLLEVHGTAHTRDPEVHQELYETLKEIGTRPVRSSHPWDDRVGKWRVSWNSYARSDDEHTYTLILREEEELALDALVVGGVELHPYAYREQISGEGLTILAKVVGSKASILRLRALLKDNPSFPVVRRGIQEQPRPMRFGVAEWSEHEGQIKARFVLIDHDADPNAHPELMRISAQNQRAAAAYYMNFVERLAELLEARGLLTPAEIEGARAAAQDEPWAIRHEFWRVPDVDLTGGEPA